MSGFFSNFFSGIFSDQMRQDAWDEIAQSGINPTSDMVTDYLRGNMDAYNADGLPVVELDNDE